MSSAIAEAISDETEIPNSGVTLDSSC